MKSAFFLIILLISSNLKAKESEPEYSLIKSEKSAKPKPGEAVYHFRFTVAGAVLISTGVTWGMDGGSGQYETLHNGEITVKAKPGAHSFQFFYSGYHNEVYTGELSIREGYEDTYLIRFRRTDIYYEAEKPVIYLYPETPAEVEVKLKPTGKLSFTYPPLGESWKCTAHPDGDLEINGQHFNYLFWEAQTPAFQIRWNQGFAVSREDLPGFLEKTLDDIGLNSKEKADFITYWGPRMMQHPGCLVHFLQQEECTQVADLTVFPEPDHINRIFMLWVPIENVSDYSYICNQNLQKINRLGFDVLEWGGAQLPGSQVKQRAL